MNEVVDTSIFWNLNQTLTYNKLFNVIMGNRGGGKSYGCKKWCIDNFIKKKEQFGYIRRYKDDIKEGIQQFAEDLLEIYPDYEFHFTNKHIYIRLKSETNNPNKWSKEEIAGYIFILSTAANKKSISYPKVTTLFFDEFILKPGVIHYLPDEVDTFMELYETVARPGTNHPRVRVFMCANSITVTNPYFLQWDLKMLKETDKRDKNGKLIWLHKTRPILVENVLNEEFVERKENSEYGAMVKGTKYGDYAIKNEFYLDDDTFIEKKSPTARYYFTFTYKNRKYGVWADFHLGKLWVSKDIDPSFILNYSLTLKDHTPNTLLINTRGKKGHFKVFTDAFKNGCLYFENMQIKNLTYEVIKMVMN